MHGRILWQFREYVEARRGSGAWQTVCKAAGLEDRIYLAQAYPDAESLLLLQAFARMTGKSAPAILQDFGEFTVPSLLGMYAHLIKPQWRTLDVVEHTEKVAHGAVRAQERGAAPPYLRAHRVSSHELVITYNSPRKMCPFAVGVGLGLGKYFQESVKVLHDPCMRLGADHCEITYTIV